LIAAAIHGILSEQFFQDLKRVARRDATPPSDEQLKEQARQMADEAIQEHQPGW
jgi:hypothetical protein